MDWLSALFWWLVFNIISWTISIGVAYVLWRNRKFRRWIVSKVLEVILSDISERKGYKKGKKKVRHGSSR